MMDGTATKKAECMPVQSNEKESSTKPKHNALNKGKLYNMKSSNASYQPQNLHKERRNSREKSMRQVSDDDSDDTDVVECSFTSSNESFDTKVKVTQRPGEEQSSPTKSLSVSEQIRNKKKSDTHSDLRLGVKSYPTSFSELNESKDESLQIQSKKELQRASFTQYRDGNKDNNSNGYLQGTTNSASFTKYRDSSSTQNHDKELNNLQRNFKSSPSEYRSKKGSVDQVQEKEQGKHQTSHYKFKDHNGGQSANTKSSPSYKAPQLSNTSKEQKKDEPPPTEASYQDLLKQKAFFDAELQRIQSTLRGVKLEHLPDGGQKIMDKVKSTKEIIRDVNKKLSERRDEGKDFKAESSQQSEQYKSMSRAPMSSKHISSAISKDVASSHVPENISMDPANTGGRDALPVKANVPPAQTYKEWREKKQASQQQNKRQEQTVYKVLPAGSSVVVKQPLANSSNRINHHGQQTIIIKQVPKSTLPCDANGFKPKVISSHGTKTDLAPSSKSNELQAHANPPLQYNRNAQSIHIARDSKTAHSDSSSTMNASQRIPTHVQGLPQTSAANPVASQVKQKIIQSYFTPASQVVIGGSQPTGQPGQALASGQVVASGQLAGTQFTVPEFMYLPQHLQELFAANPQAMTLYGGRMTAQRLRQVGSITTEAIDKLHKQLESCPSIDSEVVDPSGLKVRLMPHQRQALAWLAWREKQHPPGGILADDMGLGKTLTTISHILRHKQARDAPASEQAWLSRDREMEKLDKAVKKSKATLIIAPASLVHQWAKEIERRCKPGILKVLLYHGPKRETNIHRLIDNDIVLTTYSLVAKEVGADSSASAEDPITDDTGEVEEGEESSGRKEELPLLLRVGWERIVLDEGHNIKNHKSNTAMAVCRLRAGFRFILTGTPIQNNLLDMYSLLRFMRFSPFDEYKVWKRHIDSGGDTKRLNTIVKALLLRRTKKEMDKEGRPIVDLPEKTKQIIDVHLSEEERTVYDRLFRKTQSTVRDYVKRHDETDTQQKTPLGMEVNRGMSVPHQTHPTQVAPVKKTGSEILISLLRLRQCCSHLSLMKAHLEAESLESDGIDLTLEEQMKGLMLDGGESAGGPEKSESKTEAPLYDKSMVSSKLDCVLKKIKIISVSESRDKSVIVSQWTQMLGVVGHHLSRVGIKYSLIQGNIPPHKRMDIVDDFNSNPRGAQVMLVSLRAGGVGLNLVGGNHLFLLDNHWNPALEEQACDRIYRMGQKKDVFIYRFLCKDTIEEKIVALQERKLMLAKSVLSGSGAKNQKLSLMDLRMLFNV